MSDVIDRARAIIEARLAELDGEAERLRLALDRLERPPAMEQPAAESRRGAISIAVTDQPRQHHLRARALD